MTDHAPDDEIREALNAIADWGAPDTVPPINDVLDEGSETISWADERTTGGRHRWRAAAVGAVAAAVVGALVVAAAVRNDDTSSVAAGGGSLQHGEVCSKGLDGPTALIGFDPGTGARRWTRILGDHEAAAVQGGVIALIGRRGSVVAVDKATGTIRWCRGLGSTSDSAPSVVAAGAVFAVLSGGGPVIALDPGSGVTRWNAAVDASQGASLLGGNAVFVRGLPTATTAPASHGPQDPPIAPSAPVLAALDPRTGARLDPIPALAPSDRLVQSSEYSATRQEITIGVAKPGSSAMLWTRTVPGITANLIGDTVFVIDQTGGTGDIADMGNGPRSTLTGYDAETGRTKWNLRIPGTPQEVFDAHGQALVANGTRVLAIDSGTGAIRWDKDHGSPGSSGRYSAVGGYRSFTVDPSTGIIVGLIIASEPTDGD